MALYQKLASLVNRSSCIALLGGGGKTSLLLNLGLNFARDYQKVLLTALTRSAVQDLDQVLLLENLDRLNLADLFLSRNPLLVMSHYLSSHKLSGLEVEELKILAGQAEVCLFECDGARNLPLKAHNQIDPAVPDFTTLTIIVIGADVVGKTVDSGLVHRPELFKNLWQVDDRTVLDENLITQVVTSDDGYLAKVPKSCPLIYFVNKADLFPDQARKLAEKIVQVSGALTFLGSVWQNDFQEVSS